MSKVQWDCTHSHMLSEKAIAEGWDTFIFTQKMPYGGNSIVGMNTKRFMLTKYDFFRWLGLLSKDDPDAIIDIVPCRIEDAGILLYLPVEDIAWNRDQNLDQPWEPGNFRIINMDRGYYGCNGTVGASPIQNWERRQGIIPVINGHSPTCIIQPASSSELIHATRQVIWIVPPGYCHAMNDDLDQDRAQKPENLIQLPSVLVDDFKKNKFTIDIIRQNRLITFPGISPEAETLLKSCSLTLEERNVPFLRAHFRLCLWLHCLAGNILPEYEGQIEERMESIKYSDGAHVDGVDEDPLDIALRRWLLSQAMSELEYAQNQQYDSDESVDVD